MYICIVSGEIITITEHFLIDCVQNISIKSPDGVGRVFFNYKPQLWKISFVTVKAMKIIMVLWKSMVTLQWLILILAHFSFVFEICIFYFEIFRLHC